MTDAPIDQTNTIEWSSGGAPISTQFDDVYFSTDNGLAESQYVFLQHNQLESRFQRLTPQTLFTIAETGFGTGLNFLAVWELWAKTAPKDAHLHFISTEKFPLAREQVQRALSLWPTLTPYANELIQQYPVTTTGFHRIHFSHNISLTLIIDDATIALQQLLISNNTRYQYPQWQGVDAWLLDGFTPAKNPDMWTEELFTTIAALSHDTTTLATFTAATHVRRGLKNVGFIVTKDSGFGLKREMLMARFAAQKNQQTRNKKHNENTSKPNGAHSKHYDNAPWMAIKHHPNNPHTCTIYKNPSKDKTIAIIGGGLAGCHTAHALAKRGYPVTIFDKAEALAQGASGNAQGIVYGKLSPINETLSDFNHHSLLYAQHFYQNFWQANPEYGSRCGVLQLSLNQGLKKNHRAIAQRLQQPDYVRYISAKEASRIANTRIEHDALFFPQLGWINPAYLCQWLTQHDNINIVNNTHIEAINTVEQSISSLAPRWQLTGSQGNSTVKAWQSETFHSVIIANASDALQLNQTKHLPIKPVRGQVTHLPTTPHSAKLASVVCGKGYIAPAAQQHCLGASFNLHNASHEIDPIDHQNNLQQAAQQTPDIINTEQQNSYEMLDGRVGFRCATSDYLPLAGPVPIEQKFVNTYEALTDNARTPIDQAGDYYPNLYTNIGHGSRGLCYAPICAEVLASLIHQEPAPMAQTLVHKLNPARFIIRHLIRKKSLQNKGKAK